MRPPAGGIEIRDKQAVLDDGGAVVVAGVAVFAIGGSYSKFSNN
jgi:hypothetical protein